MMRMSQEHSSQVSPSTLPTSLLQTPLWHTRFTQTGFNEHVEEEGKFGGRVEKKTGGCMFRHGTHSAKSSPALPPSLAQAGAHKPQHKTSSGTSQLLPNTGSKEKSTQHKFLSTELEQTSSFGSTLKWQQVQLTQPCHQPTAESWQIPAQASASVAAHMWYWYFFWSCAKDMKVNSISRGVFAQCNLLIFCPFWLYKIQVTHFSIKQYMSYPNWISSVCLHFQIVYSSSNSVFL